jgi:hypothetical protein
MTSQYPGVIPRLRAEHRGDAVGGLAGNPLMLPVLAWSGAGRADSG